MSTALKCVAMAYYYASTTCRTVSIQCCTHNRAYDNGQSSDIFRPTLAFDRPNQI